MGYFGRTWGNSGYVDFRRGERILWCEFVKENKGCVGIVFLSFCFNIGDSSKVRFWYDIWHGDIAFKDRF